MTLGLSTDLVDNSKLSLLQCFNLQLVAGVRLPQEMIDASTPIGDCSVLTISPDSEQLPAIEYVTMGFVRDINF